MITKDVAPAVVDAVFRRALEVDEMVAGVVVFGVTVQSPAK